MSYYANLKIKSKLIAGFSSVLIISIAIAFFAYFQIYKLERAGNYLFEKSVKPVEYIGDISSLFQRVRVNTREYIQAKDRRTNDFYEGRLSKFNDDIDALHIKLEQTLVDTESKRMFMRMVQAHNDYYPHLKRVMEYSKLNQDDDAITYLKSEGVMAAEREEIDSIESLQEYLVINAEKIAASNAESAATSGRFILSLMLFASLLAAIMAILITRSIVNPLKIVFDAVQVQQEGGKRKAQIIEAVASGDLSQELSISDPLHIDPEHISRDEAGILLKSIAEMSEVQFLLDHAFTEMTIALRHNREQEATRDWFKNGQNQLNILLRGDKNTSELTKQILVFLTEYLAATVGVFYTFDVKEKNFKIAASYALTGQRHLNSKLELGEGLAGQAALEKKIICVNNAPNDYLQISSGLGEAEPVNIIVIPLLYNNILLGILEIGTFKEFSDIELEFLKDSQEGISIALSVNKSRQLVNELLEQTQSQTEELRVQQEELQQTNEELEERAQMLELQREQIRAKNREVEEASRELQRKANELERVSTYKSEFLANMSHELRTPLNSLMILSSLLRDNRDGNLTAKQVEFAATINGAGRDLLTLINDILDLSKIESGHLEFHYENLELQEICEQLTGTFNPITSDKGIDFNVTIDATAPGHFTADSQRTQQILKNLLSNACKFTSNGTVSLHTYSPDSSNNPLKTEAIAFAVTDTGIGIADEKQALIFNAFQQADGSTSRTYGGTGLGLSISRQLARSMGGEIFLSSELGKGSTFTLYLPVNGSCTVKPQAQTPPPTRTAGKVVQTTAKPAPVVQSDFKNIDPLPMPIPDDREQLKDDGKSILIIEDDLTFAGILANLVRGRGFSVLVAADGENGITMAELYQPNAIILDVMLPHIDGWGVMRSLKDNAVSRHIPVHFITCLEERQKAMNMGAVGFVTKPVSSDQLDTVFGTLEAAIDKTMKMLLIVEDDEAQASAMVALLEVRDVTITVADSGAKAIELLSNKLFDCIVLDLGLADMGAFELLEELKKIDPDRRIPVIIHTGRELSHEDEVKLHHYAESIIIKGAKSPERLLNEVTLFLHLVETSLDPVKQRMIRAAQDKEAMLEGKKILIVDDDMRNIFSLSSALSEKNIIIYEAENGHEALKRLEESPDIDLVLMDIMMPEMDGYEAMRRIRKLPNFHSLPIIALTAKAMKGDREECLKAGASDYIPKPVDMEKLFSLLRVWLYSPASSDSVDMG